MLNWRLLRSDSRSTVELWQIPKIFGLSKVLKFILFLRKFQRSNGPLFENSSER